MAEVSIVIVTYNSRNDIENCLSSVYKNCPDASYFEMIIVDNNSSDDTVNRVRKYIGKQKNIKLIENKDNKGYTLANNQGMAAAKGKYILLLNPDIVFVEDPLKKLTSRLEELKAGAISPQLINPDWTIQPSCRTFPRYSDMFLEFSMLSEIFPKSRIISRWKMNYFGHDHEREVDQPMAAALMVRSEVMKEVKFFDDRFNMFFNDVDLCKKIHDTGYKIFFTDITKMIHLKGTSVYKDRKRMIRIWNEDCLKYFKKYYSNFILYNFLKTGLYLSAFVRK